MFNNKSKVSFASLIIGGLYLIYLVSYFTGANTGAGDEAEQVGAAIATALVLPHMFFVILAVIFNAVAFFVNAKWSMITSLVMYCVAAVMFLIYAPFLIPNIILASIAIGKIKVIKQELAIA